MAGIFTDPRKIFDFKLKEVFCRKDTDFYAYLQKKAKKKVFC